MCNCFAREIFNGASRKSSLKIYLLLHFSSNHPETFRICFKDHFEIGLTFFFDFENLGPEKIELKFFYGLSQNSGPTIFSKWSLEHIVKFSG